MSHAAAPPSFRVEAPASGGAMLFLEGDWCLGTTLPPSRDMQAALADRQTGTVVVDAAALGRWDSMLATRLMHLRQWGRANELELDCSALPEGLRRLLELAAAVGPARPQTAARPGPMRRLSLLARQLLGGASDMLHFFGELSLAGRNLLRGRADARWDDFLLFVQQTGPNALGIVTLIAVLVGMILAYLGSVQLQQFGAQVYVADLVALGMVREMGALMTAVILAGRTGASFAAQLGTMQTNDEIDAITILGISPVEFLVLPRLLAVVLMLPLLTLYADVLGIIGGALVGIGMDVSFTQYLYQTRQAIDMGDIGTGLVKSVAFGLLIGIAGCRAGLQCGRDSAAVGEATTNAVVRAIVYIIVADALFNIIYYQLGI